MNSLPPPIPPPPVSPSNDQSNFAGPLRYDRQAIASLVCLIGGCLKFFSERLSGGRLPLPPFGLPLPPFGLPLFPMALVFGILSLKRIKAEPERFKGRGMALAGIIIPSVAMVVGLVVLFIYLIDLIRSGGPDLPW